jgi:hypothetical protein
MPMPLKSKTVAKTPPAPARPCRPRLLRADERPEILPGKLYTLEEGRRAVRVRRGRFLQAVRSGELKTVKPGRALLVWGAELKRWINRQGR